MNRQALDKMAGLNRAGSTVMSITMQEIDEWLAALEGVTPGPYRRIALGGSSTVVSSTMAPRNDRRTAMSFGYRGDEFCLAAPTLEDDGNARRDYVEFAHRDAAHIARCDPDTMRSVLAELLTLRATEGDLLEALQVLFSSYKSLTDSGDAGFWAIENQPEGKVALAAIAKATGAQP